MKVELVSGRQILEHYYSELCAALTRYEAEGGTLEELYSDVVDVVCEMDADYDF
jgi:hypothetical protein